MIMNDLHHPNVVRIYDWGRENGRLYISMEYLDGVNLEEVIKRRGRLGLDLTVAIVKPVAEAAQYVHQKGYVRNDIKPNNIMLTTAGRVCLLDFGISRAARSKPELEAKFDTDRGVIIGTPQFMAPEQFERYTADERSDIYSLGVMLYKMLTGQFPFDGSDFVDIARAHLVQSPAPPSQRVPLPPAVDGVILKCLEKDPDKRFRTMAELADALVAAAGDLPPVDLKSVVNMVREEAKEVEQMDRMLTMAPAHFPVPAMPSAAPIEATGGTWPGDPAPQPPQSIADTAPILWRASRVDAPKPIADEAIPDEAPAITGSMVGAPINTEAPAITGPGETQMASLYGTGGHRPSDPRPRIALLRGRAEDVDWRLTAVGTAYMLEKKTSVGRSSENDVVLRDAKISRYHAEFNVDGETWFIEDYNSIVGTFVGGEKIIARHSLRDGDEVQIGYFVFIFNQAVGARQAADSAGR
jgi:serine/threonine-protein kinase